MSKSNVVPFCPVKPGQIVGAGRWPEPLHAGMPPWHGVVLAIDDPMAWAGSLALGDNPTQETVDKHLARLRFDGITLDSVPVLWSFGNRRQVYWERWNPNAGRHSLRDYETDVAMWRIARGEAPGLKLRTA